MKNWPKWIPFPGSWMSAILLTLLTSGIAITIQINWQLGYSFANFFPNFSPRWLSFFGLLAILSPILVIGISHHLLHLFLDRFFPDSQSPEIGKTQGLIPGLMSWWEGIYGWLTLVLSILITTGLIVSFFPYDSTESLLLGLFEWDKNNYLFTIPTLLRTLIAAYLYHIEQLMRQRFMSVGGIKTNL